MKNFIFVVLLGIVLLPSAYAQSGRRVQPTPKPTPLPVTEDQYSDSKPLPPRATVRPTLRNIEQKTSKETKSEPEILSDSDDETIKVDTNLVTIPVSVFDRNGLYIADLDKENFTIFEDGKEQQIEFFATSDTPVTVALLIDTSPSTEFKIDEIQTAAIAFVDQLKPQDKVIVIEFDGNYSVLTEATTDRQRIYKAIRRADFGNGTSLYDTVDYTLRKALRNIQGRKAVVLFTDGVDTTSSRSTYDRSVNEAEESEAIIFPIYYNTFFDQGRINSTVLARPNTRGEYALAKQYLKDLADYTGGRVFDAAATGAGLTRTFESIAEELRRQYTIGYIPQEIGTPGQRKAIKVRVNRSNLVIRARDGYIVGQQQKSPAK
ncbi:MAG: VWA domain-containing protein [Acidobacteria bacterium]|nr:VWA domain-containing protein [Acidobacteriota bacterium]